MKLTRKTKLALASASALALALTPAAYAGSTLVVGGASSVASIVGDCKVAYTAATGDSFAYASSSSGQGQKDMESAKNDFSFSDSAHLTSQSGTAIPASEIHIPTWVWPIGIQYKNFLGNGRTLALSTTTVAKIFAGKITKWNDPAIVADNKRSYTVQIFKTDGQGNPIKDAKGQPILIGTKKVNQSVTLPPQPITVIYRGDSSGTTGNLLAALGQIDKTNWANASISGGTKVFASSDAKAAVLADPIHFQAANGSAGVAQLAAKTPYSITYAEVNYAAANNLKVANLINPAGSSVAPDSTGVGAFLASATQDANGFLTYDYATKEKGAYPLGIVSYLLADTKYPDASRAKAVKDFANYILSTKCSKDAGGALGFSVIDGELLKKSQTQVAKIG